MVLELIEKLPSTLPMVFVLEAMDVTQGDSPCSTAPIVRVLLDTDREPMVAVLLDTLREPTFAVLVVTLKVPSTGRGASVLTSTTVPVEPQTTFVRW
jgi:hypothetical protein